MPGEAIIAEVKLIEAEGMTVVPAKELAYLASAMPDLPVSREGLARLVAKLECRYRELGYVFARAAVVGDPVAEPGRYRIVVQEGVVNNVEALADQESVARLALRAFRPVKRGKPLRAADVRRGLAHAASVGLSNVRPTIRRSRTDPAALDLVLIVSANPNQVFAQAQNGNSDTLGPWGALVGTRWSGATPLEESTTFGVYTAQTPSTQWSAQFDTQALVNGDGLKLRLGGAYSRARPGGALAQLELDSKTLFTAAELSAPLQVRRGLVTSWRAGIETLDQKTTFFGDVPLGEDHLRVAFVGTRTDGLLANGVWFADFQARKGLSAFGATRRGDTNASRFDANPQSLVLRGEVEAGLQLSRTFSLRLNVKGQWTDQQLSAFEGFSYGGLSGGQGFDPGALSGDSGVAALAQLYGPGRQVSETSSIRPFGFISTARLWASKDQGTGYGRGQTVGFGVQMAVSPKLQLEATFAQPFGRIQGTGPDAYGSRVLLSFTYSFDPLPRKVPGVLPEGERP
jgi:hemolysin activation/secretion protein